MTPLPVITALARAGALAQAARLFEESGYARRGEDPASLAVKGRLLKDQALSQDGEARRILLGEAAAAYQAADAIAPQPYLLINAATLAMLGGESEQARTFAGEVLDRLAAPEIAETPYWIAATRAEALLLQGDVAGADAALATAIACDPTGWSDHASTLRQFSLICDAARIDPAWMTRHRPPRSLHFVGHMGVASEDSADLQRAVSTILAEERVGFAYGALAAGADIVIAEALIAHGVELHIILPTQREAFVAQSVVPFGAGWQARFETCIARAASVRSVTQVEGDYEPLATALGGDVAMGAAWLNARMIESEALQLLVIDEGAGEFGDGAGTARDAVVWQRSGARQRPIVWRRSAAVPPSLGLREGRADRRLMALLHVGFEAIDSAGDAAYAAALDGGIAAFWADAKARNPIVNQPSGNARIFGFVSALAAANFAIALRANHLDLPYPMMIAGHYGLAHLHGGEVSGPAIAALIALSHAIMPGTITIGDEFAAALSLRSGDGLRTQYVGDCVLPNGGSTRLFGLGG